MTFKQWWNTVGFCLEVDDEEKDYGGKEEAAYNVGLAAGMERAAEIADQMAGFNGIVIKDAIREEKEKL
jgi:hypothetical protein